MKSRSAESTLLGFYYQFDKTIQTILEQNDEDNQIIVEGIEDVDIKTSTEETAMQIKYQAETNGTDSVLRKPIMLMLEHFKNNQSRHLTYHLYGHYKDNDNVKTDFDFSRIQKMMQYEKTEKGKKVKHDFLKEKNITQQEVENFIKKFKLTLSKSFDEHQKDTLSKIKSEMNVATEEEADFLYSNALKVVNDLAIQKIIKNRQITKKDFKSRINTKNTLFTIWFMRLKGLNTYCKTIHGKYFKSQLNTTKKERFFIVPNGGIDSLKNVIYAIEGKFYKTSLKEVTSGAPYIIVNGISKQDLISLKKAIHNESKTISDGVPFFGADFNAQEVVKPSTKENKISIKFIETSQISIVLENIKSSKEIYQFYSDKKELIDLPDGIQIQIESIENINQIIKGA